MNASELQLKLRAMDKQGMWLFTRNNLRTLFPAETDESLKKSLARHTKMGLLTKVAHSLYATPDARSQSAYPLEAIANRLRPLELNYISAESVLSEEGLISQVPVNYLLVMTTGRSKTYDTPFGLLELRHTDRDPATLKQRVTYDNHRGIYRASVEQAYRDLKRLGRNTELVDEQLMKERQAQ